ncbi:UNVERIFIED_CONTAM: hypothetical protein H355_000029 [Colinus virginianus]|nr:hypothetical protein H355_000029 [Colinus virginianus]
MLLSCSNVAKQYQRRYTHNTQAQKTCRSVLTHIILVASALACQLAYLPPGELSQWCDGLPMVDAVEGGSESTENPDYRGGGDSQLHGSQGRKTTQPGYTDTLSEAYTARILSGERRKRTEPEVVRTLATAARGADRMLTSAASKELSTSLNEKKVVEGDHHWRGATEEDTLAQAICPSSESFAATTPGTAPRCVARRLQVKREEIRPADNPRLQASIDGCTGGSFACDQKDNENPSGRQRYTDDVVVFKAPQFTTKIRRHVDKILDEVKPYEAPLETDGRGSLVEEHLDSQCAAADAARGGKRIYSRFHRDDYYCFEEKELDFSKRGLSCVDSCGVPIRCRGRVNVYMDEVWRSRPLEVDIQDVRLKGLYCVVSRLQARLNELCGTNGFVWRVRNGVDSCVNIAHVDWRDQGAFCVDNCGKPTRCYGVPRVFVPNKDRDQLEKRKKEEIQKLCRGRYNGCQTVTRSGRTCQKWKSNEPHAHVELSMEDHNYCRNPYGEKYIWCYTTDPQVRFDYCDPLGPTYPGDVVTRLTTTDEREVTLRGEALSVGDLLTVISGTNPKDCTRRNQFTVEMEALGGTPKALETDSTVVVRTTLVQVVNQGREAKSSPLRVPTTGRYMLCWNGARQDFSSTAVAENLLVTGFNSNQNFVLVRSPFHQYSSLQQSTLYISTYRSDARIEPDAVTIREASTPPCQGKEIGRSIQIKMLNTLSTSDVEEKLYKASCVLGDTPREANSEEVTLLDAGKPDMHLLVVNSNEDAIRFEAFVSATDNIPSIRHMFILPLHLYSQDPEDVLLATFREGITGPQLQYGPLSTTGRIPEFFYQPRECYTLLRCTACGGNSTKYCPGGEEPCDPGDPHCVDGKKPAEPKPCPENTRIPAGFDVASSVGDCKCEPGFAYKSEGSRDKRTNCVPCPPGSYKPYVQNTACNSLCGASATSFAGARSQSQCFCEEGTFRVGETCHSCPTGAVCAGGLLPEAELKIKNDPQFTQITPAHHVKPFAKPGFFLSKLREELLSLNDWRFTACPIQKACLKEGVCVETMTEYLCSECRPNFTSNFAKGEMCTACPSMGWNISLITVYYLGILLFNIVMTYMNVAAGFNRRSIHSIVIKIASNFLTCMSVVGALDFNNIRLPDWAARLTTRVTAQVTVERRVQWLSVDCLLRQGFHLSYPDSFFYTMLFYALLPIVLPIFATAIMYVLVSRMQAWYRVSTKRKLNLINQAELCGLTALSEQLRERCAQDRVFLIFRYIPLPGESRLTRFAKFMEDMIPIYVTVLFFLHSPTTTQMLSLLDCTYMDFGRGHKAKYFLRAAMSVECEFGPGKPYFKYLALGIVGLCIWSIGIPLSGFMVLYMNRKNLYSRATRLKYGFLHNGFLKKYWYWETVAFARKFLVLMSTSVGLIHSKNTGYTRIWTAMLISIVFLVFHLIAQPFDKRSYLTLDRLETHSMGIWTVTCVIMAMMLGSDFSGNINMTLLCILVLLAALFLLEVAFSLMIAYFDNVRAQKTFFTVPVLGRLFKFFGRLSEKRRAHEPVVIYDAENEVFQLVAAKRHGWQIFSKKADKIYLAERDYFIKVLAETLWFAVAHMKLNVIPGAFLEFILLLGMTIHKMDESSQENKKSLQAIADGDLSRLTEWSRNEHAKKEDAKRVREQKRETKRRLGNFYRRFGMGLHRRRKPHFQEQSYEDKEVMAERIQDLEGTTLADETSSDGSGQNDDKEVSVQHLDDEVDDASISSALPSLADGSVGDLEDGTLLFIDKEQMTTGIVLSELYLALLKLQQKESSGIGNQYEVFRSQRLSTAAAQAEQLLDKNKKLKLIRFAFQSLITSTPEELQKLCVDEKSFAEKRKELAELNAQIKLLNDRLQELGTDPEKLDKEIGEEWIDKEDFDCLAAQQDAASQEFDMGDGEEWIDKEDFDCLAAQQDAASQEFDMGDGDSEEEGQRANDHEYNMEP